MSKSVLFIGMVEFISVKTGKVVNGPLYCCVRVEDDNALKDMYADRNFDRVLKRAQAALKSKLARKAVFDSPHGFNKNPNGTRLYKFEDLSYDDFNTAQRVLSS